MLTAITEGLSAFELFHPAGGRNSLDSGRRSPGRISPAVPQGIPAVHTYRFGPRSFMRSADGLLISALVVMSCVIGLIAVIAPPTNEDSMSYHMARVRHWIQQQSVAHYPTHITRQLFSDPGRNLRLRICFSSLDRSVGQLRSMVQHGRQPGRSLADRFPPRCRQTGRGAGCGCGGDDPHGDSASVETQNDSHTAAFWLACFCYALLRIR